MNSNYFLDEILQGNGLDTIQPVPVGKKERLQQLTNAVSIFNCLARFEADDQVDYLLIDNPGFQSNIVLINNKIPVVFTGYDELGKMEKYAQIEGKSHSGKDCYMFANRFILFTRYSALIDNKPKSF